MKKILFLHFPGTKLYIREYYCSKVSKGDYLAAPIDLVMQSGIFNTGEFDLKLIDGIVDKKSPKQILKEIDEYSPDVVIGLIGSVSLEEDRLFLKELLEKDTEVFLTGDVLITEAERFMNEFPKLTGVITNFIGTGVYHYLRGEEDKIKALMIRKGGEIKKYPERKDRYFSVNTPAHEMFISKKYRMPFVRKYPFATTIMTYGCPFKCSFCIMSKLGYQERTIEEMVKELDQLKKLGVRDILFLDQTLGINKENFKQLMHIMIDKKYNFGWFGFSRVDVLDKETMQLMKNAGCHTLRFGVESGSEYILKTYGKGYTLDIIRRGIKTAQEVGINLLGTFILGLPDETFDMAMETIKFSKELDLDVASFNFAVPRYGTDLRDEAKQKGLIDNSIESMDQSGDTIVMGSTHMTRKQIETLRKLAIREFYLRPSYLWKRLRKMTSWTEFVGNLNNARLLMKNTFWK
ncbi:MAG: radical SAM protein [candidate division SR1 bacterium]|nr:radical SAM protein [candidate division SR1 bacterium]